MKNKLKELKEKYKKNYTDAIVLDDELIDFFNELSELNIDVYSNNLCYEIIDHESAVDYIKTQLDKFADLQLISNEINDIKNAEYYIIDAYGWLENITYSDLINIIDEVLENEEL